MVRLYQYSQVQKTAVQKIFYGIYGHIHMFRNVIVMYPKQIISTQII